jgi:putative selenate reductase
VAIPPAVANSVTLSTMHGCPPDEIERIARYLIEERGLHTVVKLNPTLLGREAVLDILHRSLGYEAIEIPPTVFEHDLQYDAAVQLISSLQAAARRRGLTFGVKLTNTLAVRNGAGRLPGGEMYMSGRALYPVTMQLFDRLAHDFDGNLRVSYSAGADAVNLPAVLSCGALPVTGCSDLLKPGGVGRFAHWLERLGESMASQGHQDLESLSRDALANVRAAAREALSDPRYKKGAFRHGLPKVRSSLGPWDCAVAPCVEACAVAQDVPEYAWLVAHDQFDGALGVVLARNPLPGVTGHVCTRLCETKCTRNDYEASVAIRALKRVAAERGRAAYRSPAATGHRVAIVGSGPSGLAAAAFLAANGVAATIFEARDVPGGMMRLVPPFRLPQSVIDEDIARILALGVELRLNSPVTGPPEDLLADGFDAVYLATGFQRDAPLRIPGADGPAVIPALSLLDRVRRGEKVDLGAAAVVVGGGDTAMDALRTARRLTGRPATLLYRRTRREMPAALEEVEGALEEGNRLEELVSPLEIVRKEGRVAAVRVVRNTLGAAGGDGRRVPVPLAGSEFDIPCDSVVVAVGQLPDLSFLDGSRISRHRSGGVTVDRTTGAAGPAGVYAGGDVVVEPGSIISACADGRRAAEAICRHLGVVFTEPASQPPRLSDADILQVKAVRARRLSRREPPAVPVAARTGFELIESCLEAEDARAEALRCVQCTTFCDKCVEVCPNRANYTFRIEPVSWSLPVIGASGSGIDVVGHEAFAIRQDRQILHVDDFCNECDNCQTFCVHQGRPYADKPRLFLDARLFAAEQDNAFRFDGNAIIRRDGGVECRLVERGGEQVFEDGFVRVRLSRGWHVEELHSLAPFEGTRSLRRAAEMAVLREGVRRSLGFLLIP